jgi:cell division protein FtsW
MSSTTTHLGDERAQRRAEEASRRRHPAGRVVVRSGPLPMNYYVIATVLAVLVPLGLVMVMSASSITQFQAGNSPWRFFQRQAMWAAGGFVALSIALRIRLRTVRKLALPALVLAVIAMALPFVPGLGVTVRGARAWVALGPVVFQPSEFLKLAVLLVCADLLARRSDRLGDLRAAFLPCLVLIVVGCGLMMAQGDLGSAIVLGAIGLAVVFLAGAPLVPLTAVAGAFAGGAAVFVMSTPYRRERWTAFLDLARNRQDESYQTWQSILSIANGGFSGTGVGAGTGKWGYVPLAHSDFVFAVLAEELGFLGVFAVLGAFVILAFAGTQAALASRDLFGTLLAGGIVAWIGIQATINVGGVVGVLPVTGLTLPFLSYGGSSLLVMMVAGGLLLNVARNGQR